MTEDIEPLKIPNLVSSKTRLAAPTILVRLKNGNGSYSVADGSIGYVDQYFPESSTLWTDVDHAFVSWTIYPGPGGSSGPIAASDLEVIGLIYIPVTKEIEDEILRRGNLNVPDSVVRERAISLINAALANI